jgi:hypothetical protein
MATLKSIKNKYLSASDGTVLGVTTNTENVSLLSFKLATADSLSKFNLVDGFSDDYQDATGVDAGGSTDEERDSSGKYYWGAAAVVNASGGTESTSGIYTFHYFTSSGNYITDATQALDIVLIGGGGGGGKHSGGGGGAGGLIHQTGRSVAAGTYAYVHGAGGATRSTDGLGNDGYDSTWNSLTAKGGGGGGYHATTGKSGGSGGGSSRGLGAGGAQTQTGQAGDSGTYGFGNTGGTGSTGTNPWPAAGGGGAAAAGSGTSGGNSGPGGAGKDLSAIFGSFGVSGFFAGGGGGQTQDTDTHGSGGSGGGGDGGAGTPSPAADGAGRDGVDYTGSGGGGSSSHATFGTYGATGGDGTLIIRRTTAGGALSAANMDLRSNAYTAQAAPTTARIILDEYTSTGSSTLNTDIKAYASRDNGTTYTQITLADQGTIETNHRLLSGSVDISGQPSGTSIKYKIETFNQGVSKQTRVYGASMAWA